jgi:hypothetical protein
MPALEILTREFGQRSGLDITANLEPAELDETIQLTVYRLIQEALTNIAKYAEARSVEINLLSYKDHVTVSVRDDGKGFDPTGGGTVGPRPAGNAPPGGGSRRPPGHQHGQRHHHHGHAAFDPASQSHGLKGLPPDRFKGPPPGGDSSRACTGFSDMRGVAQFFGRLVVSLGLCDGLVGTFFAVVIRRPGLRRRDGLVLAVTGPLEGPAFVSAHRVPPDVLAVR